MLLFFFVRLLPIQFPFLFVQLLYKKYDSVGVVLFGTDGTFQLSPLFNFLFFLLGLLLRFRIMASKIPDWLKQ